DPAEKDRAGLTRAVPTHRERRRLTSAVCGLSPAPLLRSRLGHRKGPAAYRPFQDRCKYIPVSSVARVPTATDGGSAAIRRERIAAARDSPGRGDTHQCPFSRRRGIGVAEERARG